MGARVRAVDKAAVAMRRDGAESYLEVALLYVDSTSHADWKAAGANAVLGGIAASDAICGAILGYHHLGDDHAAARRLLDQACAPDTRPGLHFKRLTDEKTNFQYSTSRVTQEKTRALVTALERLIRTVHDRT